MLGRVTLQIYVRSQSSSVFYVGETCRREQQQAAAAAAAAAATTLHRRAAAAVLLLLCCCRCPTLIMCLCFVFPGCKFTVELGAVHAFTNPLLTTAAVPPVAHF